MTIVLDISCPECGQSEPVRKVGLATYRCTECGIEFDHEDVGIEE
ncbi:MAG: hypothetical protein ABEI39_03675 [Halobacteriales archaeon]